MSTQQLFYALNREDLDEARQLLDSGVDVNVVLPDEGVAPLHLAAGLGTQVIKLLLEYAADPNIRSAEGFTPLHIAATWGEVENIRLLLCSGADPHVHDQAGFEPVDVARAYGHTDCVCLLKYYSLLLDNMEDDCQPKYTRESLDSVTSPRSHLPVVNIHGDNTAYDNWSNNCAHSPPHSYLDVLQTRMYDCVRRGQRVVLDVTSPHHPTLHTSHSHSPHPSNTARTNYTHSTTGLNRRKTLKISDCGLCDVVEVPSCHVYEYRDASGNKCGLNRVRASSVKPQNSLTCSCDEINNCNMCVHEQLPNTVCCNCNTTCNPGTAYTQRACRACVHKPVTRVQDHKSCTTSHRCQCQVKSSMYEEPVCRSHCENCMCLSHRHYCSKSPQVGDMVNKMRTLKSTADSSTPPSRPLLDTLQRETPEAKIDRWASAGVFDLKPVHRKRTKNKKWFQPLDERLSPASTARKESTVQPLISDLGLKIYSIKSLPDHKKEPRKSGQSYCEMSGQFPFDDITPSYDFTNKKSSQDNDCTVSSQFDSSSSLFSDCSINVEPDTQDDKLSKGSPGVSSANNKKPPLYPGKRCADSNDTGVKHGDNRRFSENRRSKSSPDLAGSKRAVLNENRLVLHRFLSSRQRCYSGPQQCKVSSDQKESVVCSVNVAKSDSESKVGHESGVCSVDVKTTDSGHAVIHESVLSSVDVATTNLESKVSHENGVSSVDVVSTDLGNKVAQEEMQLCQAGDSARGRLLGENVSEDARNLAEAGLEENSVSRSTAAAGSKDPVSDGSANRTSRVSDVSVVSASSCDTFQTCEEDTEFTMVTRVNDHTDDKTGVSTASALDMSTFIVKQDLPGDDTLTRLSEPSAHSHTERDTHEHTDCSKHDHTEHSTHEYLEPNTKKHSTHMSTECSTHDHTEPTTHNHTDCSTKYHTEHRTGDNKQPITVGSPTHRWDPPQSGDLPSESDLITSDESFTKDLRAHGSSRRQNCGTSCSDFKTPQVVDVKITNVDNTPTNTGGREKSKSNKAFSTVDAADRQKTPSRLRKQLFKSFSIGNKTSSDKRHTWKAPRHVDVDESDLMTSDESFLLRNESTKKTPGGNIGDLVNTFDRVSVQSPKKNTKGDTLGAVSRDSVSRSLKNKLQGEHLTRGESQTVTVKAVSKKDLTRTVSKDDVTGQVCEEARRRESERERVSRGYSTETSSTKPSMSALSRRLSTITVSSASSSPDLLDAGFCRRASLDSVYSHLSCREYLYRDSDRGVVLIERHIPSECDSISVGDRQSLDSSVPNVSTTVDSDDTELYDWRAYQSDTTQPDVTWSLADKRGSAELTTPSMPDNLTRLNNDEVRDSLRMLGEDPGPVLPSTRQLYLSRLTSLQSSPCPAVTLTHTTPDYSPELRLALQGNLDLSDLDELEVKMVTQFEKPQGRKWREGTIKSSFNYLLLDPRVSRNLPLRARHLGELETFRIFIAAIFYVGKGKRSRPYSHLYEAIAHMQSPKSKPSCKVQHIVDIWREGVGVVSLHCFQSTIPVEAYTREACMVEAFGLPKLTNMKKGDFYGTACSWSLKQKRKMGVFLLKKALQIFLSDGERQICPYDIKQ